MAEWSADGRLNDTRRQFCLPPRQEASFACQPATNQCLPQSVIQRSQSHNQHTPEEDEAIPDLTNETPQPRAIHYQEPSFSFE